MSATNSFETSILKLIFNGTAIANIADNAASGPLTVLYLSLHTADPGETGSQTTSEAAYTSYVRASTNRTTSGWTVSGSTAVLAANVDFATATGGSETETHFGIGASSTGAGTLYISGTVTPNIVVSSGVTPRLTTATQVSCD